MGGPLSFDVEDPLVERSKRMALRKAEQALRAKTYAADQERIRKKSVLCAVLLARQHTLTESRMRKRTPVVSF